MFNLSRLLIHRYFEKWIIVDVLKGIYSGYLENGEKGWGGRKGLVMGALSIHIPILARLDTSLQVWYTGGRIRARGNIRPPNDLATGARARVQYS